ncbi:MAG: hypothetical protein Fur0014_19160 [Rubrivivax sp.]
MSTTVLHAPRIAAAAPVGAGFWPRLWKALEAHGQRRAAAELRRTAWRYQSSDPALALRLIEAARQAERA